ncbi:MAG: hypothetical protein GZ088_03005 [Acidipila sp.]|nr:hypothetical protein [Acidipila sp.]
MTNWRQIQARIRKARVGLDAPAKLLSLFDKTRDAMVAFELARAYETDSRNEEALAWYVQSYERFRRDDWKKKAAEAIIRLGGTVPVSVPAPGGSQGEAVLHEDSSEMLPPVGEAATKPVRPFGAGLPTQLFHSASAREVPRDVPRAASGDSESAGADAGFDTDDDLQDAPTQVPPGAEGAVPLKKRRRRGRRGGRGRRKPQTATPGAVAGTTSSGTPVTSTQQSGRPPQTQQPPQQMERPRQSDSRQSDSRQSTPRSTESRAPDSRQPDSRPSDSRAPVPPHTAALEATGWLGPKTEALRARAGDPALASHTAHLEMQLRRLIACPPYSLEDADSAPAGPGVLILSDSDLTTHYYIVACSTLRIEMGRLGRNERGGSRGHAPEPPLRSRLAEHLGIGESQVTRYLNQHCVARFLQLDEGASRLAHFAIAVLRPALND